MGKEEFTVHYGVHRPAKNVLVLILERVSISPYFHSPSDRGVNSKSRLNPLLHRRFCYNIDLK